MCGDSKLNQYSTQGCDMFDKMLILFWAISQIGCNRSFFFKKIFVGKEKKMYELVTKKEEASIGFSVWSKCVRDFLNIMVLLKVTSMLRTNGGYTQIFFFF